MSQLRLYRHSTLSLLTHSLTTDVDFHQLNLTRGSSYLPLPEWLACKKAIVNPRNEDQECFKWAVIAASRWEEIDFHPERISKLARFEADFDWSGIGFPVSVKDIKKFELRNQISINLLAIEDKQIYICRKGGNNYERVMGSQGPGSLRDPINLMLTRGHGGLTHHLNSEAPAGNRRMAMTFAKLRLIVFLRCI